MYSLYTESLGIHSSSNITTQTLACETLLLAQVLNVLQASSLSYPCNLFTAEAATFLSVCPPLSSLLTCVKEE